MLDKILMVTDHHLDSGIGKYSYELFHHMLFHAETTLMKPYKKTHLDHIYNNEPNVKPYYYKSLRSMGPYILPYFIAAQTLGNKSTINHAHWFMAGKALLLAKKKNTIVTMHDVSLLHIIEKKNKFNSYYSSVLTEFKENNVPIITVSNQAREDAIQYGKFKAENVFSIPNGINFEQFFPKLKANDKQSFKILYTGGLGPRKNLQLLLSSYAIIEKKYPFVELNIAGSHPEQTPYMKMAETLKLKRCKFLGYIADNEMNKLYNNSDLLVFTSTYEGFGFTPLEAMACKIPVITTAGGALSEIAGGGAMITDYDVDDLVSRMIYLIENKTQREQLAQIGYQWVKQYTWEKTVNKTIEIYKNSLL